MTREENGEQLTVKSSHYDRLVVIGGLSLSEKKQRLDGIGVTGVVQVLEETRNARLPGAFVS